MAAAGSVANILKISPGFIAERRFARPQDGQRAEHSSNIELGVVVYQFTGHAGLFQLIVMMPISSQ